MPLFRRLLPLGLVFLTVGIATAVVGPFLGLFLGTAVGASPVQSTFFLVTTSLSGVVVSWAIGRFSDRRPIRRTILIVAALAGCVASGVTAVVRDYWVLLALTATATAIAGALFPQSFAYARQALQRDDPARAAMGISTLRTVFSIAWVGGPSLAAFLVRAGDFEYVYGTASVLYLVAALLVAKWLPEVEAPVTTRTGPDAAARAPWQVYPIAGGFVMMQTSMVLNVQVMPLFISTELGGSVGDAGVVLGICAALEIPLMLGFGKLSTRMPLNRIILFGAGCGVAYQALAASATSVRILIGAQILNAIMIAAASGLGISYFQDMMPRSPGRASTMFANTFPLGQILTAPLFGVAQEFGFRLAYALNLGLSILGLILVLVPRPPSPEDETDRVTAENAVDPG